MLSEYRFLQAEEMPQNGDEVTALNPFDQEGWLVIGERVNLNNIPVKNPALRFRTKRPLPTSFEVQLEQIRIHVQSILKLVEQMSNER